jgi:subtilisin family serine protease
MAATYRKDVILAHSDVTESEIERWNNLLAEAGLGRPLSTVTRRTSATTLIGITGVDPVAVRDTIRRVSERHPTPVFEYSVGTVDDPPADRLLYYQFGAAGCRSGHSATAWLSAPEYEWQRAVGTQRQPDIPWGERPVVALLDTGVHDHPAFHENGEEPAVVEWEPLVPYTELKLGGPIPKYYGHGTFLAGLIRLHAPDAQVLSLRVMNDDGRVDEATLVDALEEVARYRAEKPVHAVCLAFGRQAHDDADDLALVKEALTKLRGVPVVASVGNEGTDEPTYPAAFATKPELSVVSVGSKVSDTERAPYSNHGVWVREWRYGSNAVSLMPLTTHSTGEPGYAWWSGTSFAAAIYAAELAVKALSPVGAAVR